MLVAFLSPTHVKRTLFVSPNTKRTTCRRTRPTCCDRPDRPTRADPPRDPPKRRRVMSPEARARISAALKGRRKSDSHRENLRRRFGGDQNPMYGRKLSAESRAKISRAMTARNQKKAEEAQKKDLNETVLDGLREKAKSSRLFESRTEGAKRPRRRFVDEREAKELDKILERVARLDIPPESVAKTIRNTEKKREVTLSEQEEGAMHGKHQKEGRMECDACKGSGMVACPECVGSFGVVSALCETCFGAGATFCGDCEGAGSVLSEKRRNESNDLICE